VGKEEDIVYRMERRLNWISQISTPDQLREEIVKVLKTPPTVCKDVNVSITEPLFGETIEKQGVVIKQYALVIAEIVCDNEKYEAHIRTHVIEANRARVFFDLDVSHVIKATTSTQ
jgi:hypothetical protein